MRIYKNRLYVQMGIPGISGFQRWNERCFAVVSGIKAAGYNRAHTVGEWEPAADEQFALGACVAPERRQIVDAAAVARFLADNPYDMAIVIGLAAERCCAKYAPGKVAAGAVLAAGNIDD